MMAISVRTYESLYRSEIERNIEIALSIDKLVKIGGVPHYILNTSKMSKELLREIGIFEIDPNTIDR